MKSVTIWTEGGEERVSPEEFLRRWRSDALPKGALARHGDRGDFEPPIEVVHRLPVSSPPPESKEAAAGPSALAQCPACGKDVSRAAAACPHCGHPIATKARPPVDAGNVLCAISSLMIPGLGQWLQGRILIGIGFFLLAGLAWMTWLGWIVHIAAMLDAVRWTGRK